ncbi:6-bladed beta-propeller [Candidatus Palauibacter sp.]|uniref:6-bladed beta-propeller n=1 Tax=Candidatus Palauibacter sp. TaxID=3101350 RepID=UPI003B02BCC5
MSEHLNPEEREIPERFERGELRRAVGVEHEMEGARQAARATFMCRGTQRLVAAVLSIAALGCAEADQETASAYATIDSAGVEILRLSDLHALDLPSIETRLVYSTAPDVELASVAGAVFLPDSSLVIADRRAAEIVFLDRDGRVRARSGREGEGPGEYTFIERIGVGADGTLFVYDRRQRRFTFLDSRGELTGVQQLEQGTGLGAAVPLVRLEGGEVLAAFETRPQLPPGLQRAPVFLVFADAAGDDRRHSGAVGRQESATSRGTGRGTRSCSGPRRSLRGAEFTRSWGRTIHWL